MRKVLGYFIITLIFLITYFLQINIFNNLTIFNIKPNLFIIFITILGMFLSKNIGFILGVIYGLWLDILIGTNLGIFALCLGLIGYLAGLFTVRFTKESRLTQMIAIFLSTLIYNIIYILISFFISSSHIAFFTFFKMSLIEATYNSILIIILYRLLISISLKLQYLLDKSNQRKPSIFIS